MKLGRFGLFVSGVSLLCGCLTQGPVYPEGARTPLYGNLGTYHRKIQTGSGLAQKYFDQGMVWAFAFNHDEAIRSFEEARRLDPNCAMASWGIALCNGPHINNPVVPPDRGRAAVEALARATALAAKSGPVEQALIKALAARYGDPPPEDRTAYDAAYAEAMAVVWERFPNDPDVGALYAEALMDLRPWDLWTETGRPQPGTPRILKTLERVLEMAPRHPGANHLYIHVVESSPNPERGIAAANRLRDLVPGSGHLVHMPSHIDVLTGSWAKAADQNVKAIASDRAYRKESPDQGFYQLYMIHNYHMLAFASMMEGRFETALASAREVVESVPDDYKRQEAALVDPFMGATYDVLKRFGRWQDILDEPPPPDYLPITTAMWRYSRGLAHAALGNIPEAEAQREAFQAARDRVPYDALLAINRAHHMLDIAALMLDGEIAYHRGDIEDAVEKLRAGIELEDTLLYMEPPEWIQPVRHTLGAVLLSAGRADEAEIAYREDLEKWPANGWSLYGLSRSLEMRDRHQAAAVIKTRFNRVWSRADTRIASSCLCVPRT